MTTASTPSDTATIRWIDIIQYEQTGFKHKILLEDENCRYTLMSMSMGTLIAEHASARNATVNVIEGQGILTLNAKEFVLEAGVFVFIPANARHAVQAVTNLAFLLTLSGKDSLASLRTSKENL